MTKTIQYLIARSTSRTATGRQYVCFKGFTSQPMWARRFASVEDAQSIIPTLKGKGWEVVRF